MMQLYNMKKDTNTPQKQQTKIDKKTPKKTIMNKYTI